RVRVLGALVDAKIAELAAPERTSRQHALDRLLDDALREPALEHEFRRAFLDAADVAGVVVIHLLVALAPGQHHLLGVDDDDVVPAVDMGRIARLVLAAQPQRHNGRKPAHDEALGVDQYPLLLDLGGPGRIGLHFRVPSDRANARARAASSEAVGRRQRTRANNNIVKTMVCYFGVMLPPPPRFTLPGGIE